MFRGDQLNLYSVLGTPGGSQCMRRVEAEASYTTVHTTSGALIELFTDPAPRVAYAPRVPRHYGGNDELLRARPRHRSDIFFPIDQKQI